MSNDVSRLFLIAYVCPGVSTTWLSNSEKKEAMGEMNSAKEKGNLDEGSFVFLKELNKINGLVTKYSCTGHEDRPTNPFGYILFRATKEMGKKFDEMIIPRLFQDNLICAAEKEWQSGKDCAEQTIPVIRFIIRFFPQKLENVAQAIIKYIIEEKYAII